MKYALIVPAYKPTPDMLPMLARFDARPEFEIVVVDDGSGEPFEATFKGIPARAHLLRHESNRGKGAALKTAMAYVRDHLPECGIVVTADADGQHRDEDIMSVCQNAAQTPKALVLGSRAFSGPVPLRSRLGNGITRRVFRLASGVRVRDTQTGLRAFPRDALDVFIGISGDRYEYEINMLLHAAQSEMPIREVAIQTVYLDGNSASHFNPFRDSLKIYLCIFNYVASSMLAFVIDTAALMVLNPLMAHLIARYPNFALFRFLLRRDSAEAAALLLGVVIARVLSATFNFFFNKRLVFKSTNSALKEVPKYALLVVLVLIVNHRLLDLLHLRWGWPLLPAKLLVEFVLFFVNFLLQGKLVYRNIKKK